MVREPVRQLRGLFAWGRVYWRHRVMSRAAHRLANARDVADAAAGLERGVVYRSDAPMDRDHPPEGIPMWPPATVIDLRGAGEKGQVHPLEDGARVVSVDLLDAAALNAAGPHGALSSLDEMYALMTAPATAPGLTRVVAEVAKGAAPALVHCTAGKDRTGLSVALILRLLGVGRDQVVADYVLTQDHMPRVLSRMLAGTRSRVGGSRMTSIPREVLTAPAAAIETVLEHWDAHEGGVEGWYLTHGGDPQTLATLRRRLLA